MCDTFTPISFQEPGAPVSRPSVGIVVSCDLISSLPASISIMIKSSFVCCVMNEFRYERVQLNVNHKVFPYSTKAVATHLYSSTSTSSSKFTFHVMICRRVLAASSEACWPHKLFGPVLQNKREKHTNRVLISSRDDVRILEHGKGQY